MSGLRKEPSVSFEFFFFILNFFYITSCLTFYAGPSSFLQVHVKAPRVKESAFSMECEVNLNLQKQIMLLNSIFLLI